MADLYLSNRSVFILYKQTSLSKHNLYLVLFVRPLLLLNSTVAVLTSSIEMGLGSNVDVHVIALRSSIVNG